MTSLDHWAKTCCEPCISLDEFPLDGGLVFYLFENLIFLKRLEIATYFYFIIFFKKKQNKKENS